MKEIPLTQGYVALVDDEDFELVSQFNWCVRVTDYTNYAKRAASVNGIWVTIHLHRFLMNAGPDDLVDHRNRNGLDCRRANLRICTRAENNRNSGLRQNNSTGFKGVSFYSARKRYTAFISVGGKSIFLGYFDDKVDAAHVYDDAARRLHGEFARLNFPMEGERSA